MFSTEQIKQSAICAHLRPKPRVEFGRRLGESGLVNSMIDVSDGLAQDLAHICEASGVGALIDFDAVPIAEEVRLVTATADEAFEFAVNGGEDFELLFTADRSREAELTALAEECHLRLTRIGEVTESFHSVAVQIRRGNEVNPLSIHGYDHFAV